MSFASSSEWLHIHRFLTRTTFALVATFSWVLIFHYWFIVLLDPSQALVRTALLYALSQVIVLAVTPYSASILRLGLRRGMIYGILFASVGFACLAGTFESIIQGVLPVIGFLAFVICFGLYRALYWVPYTAEKKSTRAGRLPLWYELPIILMPILGGLIIVMSDFSPTWLLYGASALLVVSVLPLLGVKEKEEIFPWQHTHTFGWLFDHARRFQLRISFLEGMQSAAILFLWPIAVLLLVGFSYPTLGVVLSLTSLVVLLTRPRMRTWFSRFPFGDSPMFHAAVTFSAWMVRMVIVNPFSIVVVDSYYRIGAPTHHGADFLAQEHAADAGVYIDENSALKEMGFALGRITMALVVAMVAITSTISTALVCAFLVAALAGVTSVFVVHHESAI